MIPVHVEVNLDQQQACVYEIGATDRVALSCMVVSTGKTGYETKRGTYKVDFITKYPKFVHPRTNVVTPGVLGKYLIAIGKSPYFKDTYVALHGYKDLKPFSSHGCIRISNKDIEHLVENYLFNAITVK